MIDEPENTQGKPEELSKSYEDLLGEGNWDVDVPDLPAEPDAQNQGDSSPSPLGRESMVEGHSSTSEESGEPESPASPPPAERIVEALLFVGGAPLHAVRAAEIIRGLTSEQFTQAIDMLNRAYRRQGRPYAILAQDQGYVLTLRTKYKAVAEKLYGGIREARLSTAAIDVLSLVAYRQPVTKLEVDALRGADCGALLRQLVRRGLIAILQRAEAGRREVSYGTTRRFLDFFGLRSLEDLPRTQDLQQL